MYTAVHPHKLLYASYVAFILQIFLQKLICKEQSHWTSCRHALKLDYCLLWTYSAAAACTEAYWASFFHSFCPTVKILNQCLSYLNPRRIMGRQQIPENELCKDPPKKSEIMCIEVNRFWCDNMTWAGEQNSLWAWLSFSVDNYFKTLLNLKSNTM